MSDETTEGWVEERYDSMHLTLRYKVESHALHFSAKEGVRQMDGTISYAMGDSAAPRSDEFDNGEGMVSGFIKWDGCSHLYFGHEKNDGYLHLCGGFYFAKLDFAMRRAWQLAAEKCESFSQDIADYARYTPPEPRNG